MELKKIKAIEALPTELDVEKLMFLYRIEAYNIELLKSNCEILSILKKTDISEEIKFHNENIISSVSQKIDDLIKRYKLDEDLPESK